MRLEHPRTEEKVKKKNGYEEKMALSHSPG